MRTVLNFPDVSISFQVSTKLLWKILPLPMLTTPQSLPFVHLQVIFASKKKLCLCSNIEAIFLICFAIPDEYLYLHLCYRAVGYWLKWNHSQCSSPFYPGSDLGSNVNSFILFISCVRLAARFLHSLCKVVFAFLFISYCCHPTQICKFIVGLFHQALNKSPVSIYLAHCSLINLVCYSPQKPSPGCPASMEHNSYPWSGCFSLEHSHACLFIHCLWLLLEYKGRIQSLNYLPSGTLQIKLGTPGKWNKVSVP